jgi:hypothetical protein
MHTLAHAHTPIGAHTRANTPLRRDFGVGAAVGVPREPSGVGVAKLLQGRHKHRKVRTHTRSRTHARPPARTRHLRSNARARELFQRISQYLTPTAKYPLPHVDCPCADPEHVAARRLAIIEVRWPIGQALGYRALGVGRHYSVSCASNVGRSMALIASLALTPPGREALASALGLCVRAL